MRLMTSDHDAGLDQAGRPWRRRLAPASGANSAIELLLLANDVVGLRPGWIRATSDGSEYVSVDDVVAASLQESATLAMRSTVHAPALLFAICEPDYHAARYPDGLSLLWRDVGALLAIAQVTATSLGLASTILGIAVELDGSRRTLPAFCLGALAVGANLDPEQ